MQGCLSIDAAAGDEDSGGLEQVGRIVAVKMAKPRVDVFNFMTLLFEIKILGHLGQHPNIVSLLEAVTENIKKREVLVALEYCENGDLLRHLRRQQDMFDNLWIQETSATSSSEVAPSISTTETTISTLNLLNWSYQISNGMAYLKSRKVIHGDLAARNILLSDRNVAKIGDFGLSRHLTNYANYLKTSKTPLPWRWLAIESLTSQTFSLQSDIWSFGVTLWEIFTLGQVPYSEKNWDSEFMKEIYSGRRLGPPKFGNQEIYTMMLECMNQVPAKRLSFQNICANLENFGACAIEGNLNPEFSKTSRDAQYLTMNPILINETHF